MPLPEHVYEDAKRLPGFWERYQAWEATFREGHIGMYGCLSCANTHRRGCPNYDRLTDYERWLKAWYEKAISG